MHSVYCKVGEFGTKYCFPVRFYGDGADFSRDLSPMFVSCLQVAYFFTFVEFESL